MGMKKKVVEPGVHKYADIIERPLVPPVPELPKTISPVKTVDKAGDDKILAKPYDRNRSIEIQALIKSTLESPVVGQMAVGKNDKETLDIITKVFDHALGLFEKNK